MRPSDRWALVSTIAPRVGVTPSTLRRWCRAHRVPASKRLGSRWWINLARLRAAMVHDGEDASELTPVR